MTDVFVGFTFLAGIALFAVSLNMDKDLDSSCGSTALRKYNRGISTIGAILTAISLSYFMCCRESMKKTSPKAIFAILGVLSATIAVLSILLFSKADKSCKNIRKWSIILMCVSLVITLFAATILVMSKKSTSLEATSSFG